MGNHTLSEVERLEVDFILSFIGVGVVCMIGELKLTEEAEIQVFLLI
jgi:hypothetical protein